MITDDIKKLEEIAARVRCLAIELGYSAGNVGAHFGGGFSAIEILTCLYCGVTNYSPLNYDSPERDRVLISKAHCVLALYPLLKECGFLTEEDLSHFEKNGYDMPGHALKNQKKGVEFSAGSLGIVLSVACGAALSCKNRGFKNRIYVLLGDGECGEGAIWESFLFACKYKLNNLTVVIDNNKLQYDGTIEDIGGLYNLPEKFRAFGFNVKKVNGHNIGELLKVLKETDEEKPSLIIAETVKGKGISFMENNIKWHHGSLSEEDYLKAKEELRIA